MAVDDACLDASILSTQAATPSSSLQPVTSSALLSTFGSAFATATPVPAHSSIGRSLIMSPKATTSEESAWW
jgi:hypothetical protein